LVVGRPRVLPLGVDAAVVEGRLAVEYDVDRAVQAGRGANQDVACVGVARRASLETRPVRYQGPMARKSLTSSQPPRVCQVVDIIIVPGSYWRCAGTALSTGANRNDPAERSRMVPKMLGSWGLGTHIHSMDPVGATRQLFSQSERNA
jgi:hypothetical protein